MALETPTPPAKQCSAESFGDRIVVVGSSLPSCCHVILLSLLVQRRECTWLGNDCNLSGTSYVVICSNKVRGSERRHKKTNKRVESVKSVFVTGAAQGIGLAIARAFAAEGCRVGLFDLNEDKCRSLLDEPEFEHALRATAMFEIQFRSCVP